MTDNTTRRINLPAWAREEMDAQDRIIREQRSKIDGLQSMIGDRSEDCPHGTGFGIDFDLGTRSTVWLPKNQRHLRVQVGEFKMRLSLELRGNGGAGQGTGVQAMSTSHHGLIVRPQATNLVHLEPGR